MTTPANPSGPSRPFGSVSTAMVTPFTPDGKLDLAGVKRVAEHLVEHGHDGIVVNGTTGESPTTTDDEKLAALDAVLTTVGDRARIVFGAGSNDTAHSMKLARAGAQAGAHGLLVVTPYYNKPTQEGIVAHINAVADAGQLPVMVYDIPGRAGVPIAPSSLTRLAENDLVVAVKDAKGDLFSSAEIMTETGLAYYSGDDELNLAHLAQGACGVVSVVGHVTGDLWRHLVDAVDAGDLSAAREVHLRALPVIRAIMKTSQGAIMAKAALEMVGVLSNRTMRLPLLEASDEDLKILRAAMQAAHLL